MTEEEKRLLFRDLVARLPYTPMVNLRGKAGYDRKLVSVHRYTTRNEFEIVVNSDDDEDYMPHNFEIEIVKPYLRPLSSMTEAEHTEYMNYVAGENDEIAKFRNATIFYNMHHFDYNGLIEKGLALPAPKGMYDNKSN